MFFNRKGQYERASKEADKGIQLDPYYKFNYRARAIAHRWRKEYDEAIADFSHVIELDHELKESFERDARGPRI